MHYLLFPKCFQLHGCHSLYVVKCFKYYLRYIAAAIAPIYGFLEFLSPVLHTIFFSKPDATLPLNHCQNDGQH